MKNNSFWEVRFKHWETDPYDGDGNEIEIDQESRFFATMEECMAYVVSRKRTKDLDISHVEIHQCYLGTWKSKITLNEE